MEATKHMTWDDGGRAAAGFKGDAYDCVVRSVAIASGLPYKEVYEELGRRSKKHERGSRRSSPRNGVYTNKKWFREYMADLGFERVVCMGIGSGCTTHLRRNELPDGRLVVKLSKHMTAMIDGVIHDTHDPSRHGTRCVYAYYMLTEGAAE